MEGRQGGREKGTRKGEDGRKLEGRGEVGCKEVWDTRGKGKEKRKTTLVITFFERGDYFKQAVRDK